MIATNTPTSWGTSCSKFATAAGARRCRRRPDVWRRQRSSANSPPVRRQFLRGCRVTPCLLRPARRRRSQSRHAVPLQRLPAAHPVAIPGRPAVPSAAASASSIPSPPNPLFNPDGTINVEATGGYTGPFLPQRQARGDGIDIVTILLVLLAFLAVAGLVPLYLLGVFPLLQ